MAPSTIPAHSRTHFRSPLRSARALGLLVAAGALVLSSCSASGSPAASVGEHELSDGTFSGILADMRAMPDFERYAVGETAVSGDLARDLLSQWISAQVLGDEMARRGSSVGQADLDEMDRRLTEGSGGAWSGASERVRSFFLEVLTTQEVFGRVAGPSDEELEELYLAGGSTSGVVCTRHILVNTREEADQIVDELEGGADFAELAAERSVDTATGPSGGVIEPSPGADCFSTGDLQASIIPQYVEASLAAEIGVPTPPFETPFGWHVVLARPFEEVSQAVRLIIGGTASTVLQQQLVTGADASVNSRYGTWVPSVGAVLPVGRTPVSP